MKRTLKIFTAAAILLVGTLVSGNEKAVRAWLAESLKLQSELKFEEALSLYTEDYTQTIAGGTTIDRAMMEKYVQMWKVVSQLPDLVKKKDFDKIDNACVIDFLVYLIEMETGGRKKVTPEERSEILKNISGENREKILKQLAGDVPSICENMRMYIKTITEHVKIISVKITGEQAVLIYESPDLLDIHGKYKLRTTEKLVRINEKWLSKECIEKRVLLKGK